MGYQHLSLNEREIIHDSIRQKKPIKLIAKQLGRNYTTIYREVKRNKKGGIYVCNEAQRMYEKRITTNRLFKIEKNPELKKQVLSKVHLKHSPEQISGKLAVDFAEDKSMQVCPEAVYQYLYKEAKQGKIELRPLLRHAHKRRRKRYQKRDNRRIEAISMRSIHKRPAVIKQNSRGGDYEGDLIEGTKSSGFILTAVERKSGFLIAVKIPRKDSITVAKAIRDGFAPIDVIHSLTLDNGSEFSNFLDMEEFLHCKIYFTDPASPWQKGRVENANGLVRQYYRKKTSFVSITQKGLDRVVEEINHRPRKILGYSTPWEVFHDNLTRSKA